MQQRHFPEGFLKTLKRALDHDGARLPTNRVFTSYKDIARVRSGELLMVETQRHLYDASWTQGLVATYIKYVSEDKTETHIVGMLWTKPEDVDLADACIWARMAIIHDQLTMPEIVLVSAILLGYELDSEIMIDDDCSELLQLIREQRLSA